MTEIRFSRGASIRDNKPELRSVPDFAAFAAALDTDRAKTKTTAGYVCAPFNGDGRRCSEGVLPVRFVALDFDRVDADQLPDLRMFLTQFAGIGWPTHSSTPTAPRERALLELSREVDRAECLAVCSVLERQLLDRFGACIKLDPATFKPEQPVYLPPTGATLVRFTGAPIDVDDYLESAKNSRTEPPEQATGDDRGEHGRQHQIGAGKRNATLTAIGGRLRKAGLSPSEIEAALLRVNADRCAPPLPADEVQTIAGSVGKYAPGELPTVDDLPQVVDLAALSTVAPQAPKFVVEGWLPQGEVALFAGHGGTGKSAVALYLCVCIALGRPFFGIPVQRRRVLLLSLEDTAAVLHWRLARTCAYVGAKVSELDGWLTIADGTGADAELVAETRDGLVLTAVYQWAQRRMAGHQVLVIDGASDAFGGSEISRRQVRQFVRAVRRLVPADGAAVILAHVDKATARNADTSQGYSGSTAWSNSVRSRWFLYPQEGADGLVLELQKSNLGAAGAQIALRWSADFHHFVGEVVIPVTPFEREQAKVDERQAVVELVRVAAAAGDPLPTARSGTRTTYSAAEARGLPATLVGRRGKAKFYRHVDELRAAGQIVVEYVKRPNRHATEVYGPASATAHAASSAPESAPATAPDAPATAG